MEFKSTQNVLLGSYHT